MTSRRTTLTVAILSATALIGLGGAGWVWMHRKADTELTTELEQLRSQLPAGTEFTWKRAVAMPVSHGARLTDVMLKKPEGTVTAAALELVGAHQKPPAPGSQGQPLLQFDHILAHTLHVSVATGTVDIRRLALDGLTLPADSSHLADLVIDHGELADMAIHGQTGEISATLGNVTLDQYGVGHPSRLVVRQFSLTGTVHPMRVITAERFSTDGSDLASVLLARIHGERLPPRDGTQSARIDNVSLKGVVGQPGSPIMPIAAFERLTSFSNTTDQKSQVAVSLTHFRVWPSGPQLETIRTLGYSRFEASAVVSALVDYGASVVHLSQLDVNAPTFGRLDLSGDLTDVNGSVVDALTGRMTQPNVAHLDATWRDNGLVGRLLKNAAIGQGMDPDAYVPLLERSFAPPGAAPDSVGAQLASYIASPGAGPLTLALSPSQPLPLLAVVALFSVATHPGLAESVGLTVQAPSGATEKTPASTPDPDTTTDEPVDPSILKGSPPAPSPAQTPPPPSPAIPAPASTHP
ncbi:3-demethylubiquinone-9 3-methyltransferase [Acetobacter fallax]|uniref:3-demethylubiquinone-9 3-methyltransferase n=1 Tax=Acetobacter fallax TaxID=1737473 RepID=A0ABX0KCC8_9PROT|nr:3-demethylubiquinone-9 3-methyltransferase [Acetobacter fallax]NHO32781.1 3-demethylubiquinone-9 3-methyltransferase [Acetobacter fallax]NHO36344.1 3-demethylubiquinone-9 3-methyltransferase [Acetobacter fallax]